MSVLSSLARLLSGPCLIHLQSMFFYVINLFAPFLPASGKLYTPPRDCAAAGPKHNIDRRRLKMYLLPADFD